MKIRPLGFLGAAGRLTIHNGFLSYQHPYGATFRVSIADIKTVTVDTAGWGKATLKVLGDGVELANATMTVGVARAAQMWILNNYLQP